RVKPDGLGLVQYAISIATFGIKRILNRTVYYHDRVLPNGYFEASCMADTPIIIQKSKNRD
ncbi:conjugal transfer protein, partial [Leuconostoc citreum]